MMVESWRQLVLEETELVFVEIVKKEREREKYQVK